MFAFLGNVSGRSGLHPLYQRDWGIDLLIEIKRVVWHEKYVNLSLDLDHDIALVELNCPRFETVLAPLKSLPISASLKCQIYGYGEVKTGIKDVGTTRTRQTSVQQTVIPSSLLSTIQNLFPEDRWHRSRNDDHFLFGFPNRIPTEEGGKLRLVPAESEGKTIMSAFPGMSGGGVFADGKLVGITSSGGSYITTEWDGYMSFIYRYFSHLLSASQGVFPESGIMNSYTNLYPYLTWITENKRSLLN